jgi:hypothetical protein
VHCNPGEAPFQNKFLDAAFLKSVGYRGQVFKHMNAAAAFNRFDPEIFFRGLGSASGCYFNHPGEPFRLI